MKRKMKNEEEKVREINDILTAVIVADRTKLNSEIIRKEKFSMPEFYSGLKKLQLLKRIDKKDNRRVINRKEVSTEEYRTVTDPYGKWSQRRKAKTPAGKGRVDKKVARKAVKSLYVDNITGVGSMFMPPGEGKVHEILKEPIELPINEHKNGAEITISGTAAGVATFLRLLNDGILK